MRTGCSSLFSRFIEKDANLLPVVLGSGMEIFFRTREGGVFEVIYLLFEKL